MDEFKKKVLEQSEDHKRLFDSLKKNPDELINLCRWIVSEIPFNDNPAIVKDAFHVLAHLRDTISFDKLLELKEMWQDTYLSEFEYLVALFENAQRGAVCNCEVYADSRFNTPPYQDDLEILGQKTREIEYLGSMDILHLKCKICQKEWEVEIDYYYHYPHSHWKKIS